jgi:hypothetical protein
MRKKPGYRYLLALTVILTLTGASFLVSYLLSPPSSPTAEIPAGAIGAIVPTVLAGFTCVIRKRFFTTTD